MRPEVRRAELERYIASSQRVRRRSIWIGVAGVIAAIALGIAGADAAVAWGLGLVAVTVAGAGLWITYGHIQEFHNELRALGGRSRDRR